MADTAQAENKTYRGNCHCGAFVFEVELPELKVAMSCKCSHCYNKGFVWAFPSGKEKFKIVKGDENTLREYRFGSKDLLHRFCPTCGTSVYAESLTRPPPSNMGVNVRTLQGVDLWSLEQNIFDGSVLPPQYEVPKFTGSEPTPDIEGADKLYTGSCHCGAVTLAFKSKPIDETFDGPIIECNCSICTRHGYVWVYPHKSQVAVEGKENLSFYAFGRKHWLKSFCKICGSQLQNQQAPITEEELSALPEGQQKWLREKKDITPTNLRIFSDLYVNDLKTAKNNGWEKIDPQYVNP